MCAYIKFTQPAQEATMNRTSALADLALAMGLSPLQAVALPTVIDMSASKVGMLPGAMIAEAARNAPLRAYLAQVCETVSRQELAA